MSDVAAIDRPETARPDLIPVFNPSTEEQIGEVVDADKATVDAAVARARDSFERGVWRRLPQARRADILWKVSAILMSRIEELAEIESRDNGMTLAGARFIITSAVEIMNYYAGWITKIHGESGNLISEGSRQQYHTYTQLEPVGVVGLIIPWNGPLYGALLKLAPALAAGCSCILKPAEETPLSALLIEDIFRQAGMPDGVVNVVTGYGETAGAALTAHPDVDKIAFTGSTETGRIIVAAAAASNLKRVTLELGGKSPLIMFDDANLAKAIPGAAFGLLAGSGQNCCCTSRMYVQRGIYDQVVEGVARAAQGMKMGGTYDEGAMLGPIISAKQRERVLGIVNEGVAAGAEVVTGGKALDRPGYFVEPTILTGTRPDMRLITDEIFGPVGSLIPFDDEDEVLAEANRTHYGLAGTIWTENAGRALRFANELRGGQIWVNCALAMDPSMPVCGHKQSGWGGERGWKGIEIYLNTKSVYVAL